MGPECHHYCYKRLCVLDSVCESRLLGGSVGWRLWVAVIVCVWLCESARMPQGKEGG